FNTAGDPEFFPLGGVMASVSGGVGNLANGSWSSVSGGADNTASGDRASVSGGECNLAGLRGPATCAPSFTASSVSGGVHNAAGGQSSVSGGTGILAGSANQWHAGQTAGFPNGTEY